MGVGEMTHERNSFENKIRRLGEKPKMEWPITSAISLRSSLARSCRVKGLPLALHTHLASVRGIWEYLYI